jgi:hypothetical protein
MSSGRETERAKELKTMMHRRWIIKALGAGALGALGGVGLVAPAGVAAQRALGDIPQLLTELGAQVPAKPANAPDFSLPDLMGTTIRLAHFKGRALMLYFWTTW